MHVYLHLVQHFTVDKIKQCNWSKQVMLNRMTQIQKFNETFNSLLSFSIIECNIDKYPVAVYSTQTPFANMSSIDIRGQIALVQTRTHIWFNMEVNQKALFVLFALIYKLSYFLSYFKEIWVYFWTQCHHLGGGLEMPEYVD